MNLYRTFNFYTFRAIFCTFNKNVIRFNNQVFNKFLKIKTMYINRDQVIDEEDNFLLFIELINVFESIFLSSHYLKLKENYVMMLLKNL